ncbi:galactosyl transferase GMA12/MNN10 family-domain-containing protein [Polychytrium aggregatum]|uniref:galactosyl transferase GMA12/MNN10 family-domain-containing protein n=1 Tax=Polychytrium aggregatum TaxID=110093 RepID=UPI0022FE9154|nr:galactosyl transferase GMA12/MNN10 family-domain-containing protein [Polychytrium aggregatum]KAI9208844.1 galactosyl transferase GMA12/MNN10 family-domain-containing protein [Polychytrium aggregatum]
MAQPFNLKLPRSSILVLTIVSVVILWVTLTSEGAWMLRYVDNSGITVPLAGAAKDPRIAIVMSWSPSTRDRNVSNYPRMVVESLQLKRNYARRHGYAFFVDDVIDETRIVPFGRYTTIVSLMNFMPTLEWIVYLDMDTIIMRPSLSLEQLILAPYMQQPGLHPAHEAADGTGTDTDTDTSTSTSTSNSSSSSTVVTAMPPRPFAEIDLIGKRDCWGDLNAGVLFLRNSDWTVGVLRAALNYKHRHPDSNFNDQDALAAVLQALPEAQRRHFILSPDHARFNKYMPGICGGGHDWHWYTPGDFLVHFPGDDRSSGRWEQMVQQLYLEEPAVLPELLDGLEAEWHGSAEWINRLKERPGRARQARHGDAAAEMRRQGRQRWARQGTAIDDGHERRQWE